MRTPRFNIRIFVLIAVVISLTAIYSAVLYKIQIIDGASHLEDSENSITVSGVIDAPRGDILDRYGRVLVSSRKTYNITISQAALLRQDDPNAILSELIQICSETGIEYTDTIPISSYSPFIFELDATSTELDYLSTYLSARNIDSELSPNDIIAELRDLYKIDDSYNDTQARALIGIRYELDVRNVIGLSSYVFLEDASSEFISIISERSLPAVSVTTGYTREYHTDYAAHALGLIASMNPEEYEIYSQKGYSMDEKIGKFGVEAAFEDYLHGTDGSMVAQTNLSGKVTKILDIDEAEPGSNIVLTLDIKLQEAVEKILESNIDALAEEGIEAEGAAVAIIEIGTGDVLTNASYPSFDIESYSKNFTLLSQDENDPLLNRVLQGLYAPGSTFKMVTAVAALETGTVTGNTYINDSGTYKYYPDFQPTCWVISTNETHGWLNVVGAIEDSCNYYFYEVGRLTGIDAISSYAYEFGFGQATGVELPEYTGTVASRENTEARGEVWNPGNTLQAAIGQIDNSFTPMQLANYVATLAGGGDRYAAHFLKSVYSSDNSEILYSYTPELLNTVEISDETLSLVMQGMLAVTTTGTSEGIFDGLGFNIGAKTGTAQTGATVNNGIFVCFAPYDDPEIAVAIVVEKGYSGSSISKIGYDILNYYYNSKEETANTPSEMTMLP